MLSSWKEKKIFQNLDGIESTPNSKVQQMLQNKHLIKEIKVR